MATFATYCADDPEPLDEALTKLAGDGPSIVGDFRWWNVGENASHSFYLGLDPSGALYKSSIDWCDVDEGYKAPGIEKSFSFEREINRNRRPVKDGDQLYLGR